MNDEKTAADYKVSGGSALKSGVPVKLVGHVRVLLGAQAPGEALNLQKPCSLPQSSRRSSAFQRR